MFTELEQNLEGNEAGMMEGIHLLTRNAVAGTHIEVAGA